MAENKKELSLFAKYKWLYLWIAAAALFVFGILMLINREFGQSVVFYLTGGLLIIFVVIRFIPLIKTIRNRWAIVANGIELFVDLVVGILMIAITANAKENDTLIKMYPFLVGGVLYIRSIVYLMEISFFGTKPECVKFVLHLALITAGSVIMARFDSFNVESLRWLLAIAFVLCGAFATGDGFINYNNYRKLYVKPKKSVSVQNDSDNDSIVDDEKKQPIIDEPSQPQDYVS